MKEKTEVSRLAYELTYHTHLLNRDKTQSLFSELGIPEYILLHSISQAASDPSGAPGRAYLKDLSKQLEIPMPRLSNMAGRLKDEGLVQWSHDGKGTEGTFLVITDSGRKAMQCQEALLTDYYSRVIAKFGKENLAQLVQQMKALEQVMDEEFFTEGEYTNGSEPTE